MKPGLLQDPRVSEAIEVIRSPLSPLYLLQRARDLNLELVFVMMLEIDHTIGGTSGGKQGDFYLQDMATGKWGNSLHGTLKLRRYAALKESG